MSVSEASAFTRDKGDDGVLVLTLDVPGEKLNTLGKGLIAEFERLLSEVEKDESVRAIVVRSGKPDSFIAGADIKDFTRIGSAEEGEALSRAGHAIFDRLEGCRVPVVAAIHGTCLGGGTELALACRYRVASDDPKTSIGLPEVMLGLVPGAGGTQRLPRLVGLATSLDLILTGRALKAPRARKAGLVDEVCPAPILLAVAKKAALGLADGVLRPSRPGIGLRERLLRPIVFSKARSSVLQKTGGHYPAPLEAVEVVKRGTATTLAEGLKLEAGAFGRLAVGDVSRNLVSVFFATQEIRKDAGYPEGTQAVEVGKLGVLGAGLMGEGCRVPVVAAIHGTCLGGGTELALACRYRVASDDPKTSIGLPEVMLGLVPGAGGTQRLPRLVGLATSLDLILTGRALKASRARKAGLVDEVCPAPILLAVAKKAALGLADGVLRPSRPGIGLRERLLRPIVFSKARSSVLQKTGGHYPAPLEAVEVVKRGTATTLAEGLKLEAGAFGRLAVGDVSRNLVSVFFATQEIRKDAGYPEGTPAVEVGKLGVLGAGLMGAGIAGVASDAGVSVRMKDASPRGPRPRPEARPGGLGRAAEAPQPDPPPGRRAHGPRLAEPRLPRASAARISSSRPSSRTSSSSGASWRRPRRRPATPASSRPTRPRSPSARSRRAAAARRRCWACTSSRPCTRCRCSRS